MSETCQPIHVHPANQGLFDQYFHTYENYTVYFLIAYWVLLCAWPHLYAFYLQIDTYPTTEQITPEIEIGKSAAVSGALNNPTVVPPPVSTVSSLDVTYAKRFESLEKENYKGFALLLTVVILGFVARLDPDFLHVISTAFIVLQAAHAYVYINCKTRQCQYVKLWLWVLSSAVALSVPYFAAEVLKVKTIVLL